MARLGGIGDGAIGCAVGIALALLGPHQAHAHARLVRAQPSDHAQLSQAPAHIELWFNELLDDGFNTIAVFPAAELNTARTDRVSGSPTLDAQDRTHLTVAVQPLPPGEYVVEWWVLSRDGHSAPGRLRFRVSGSH